MSFRCSDGARVRADPMIGTAPPQGRWLLVEHPGPWPVTAPYDSGLSQALLARLGHPDLRVVLIRRYGRRTPPHPPTWALAQPGQPLTWGLWREPRHLLDAVEHEPRGTTRSDPVVLVCTHGVHDVCCAVRGRPVVQALAARWPDAVWECSHLGGDRFAANVMIFPDGTCYGGLDADEAPDVVAGHLAGRLAPAYLRGIAGLSPAEQAAVAAVHARFGPAGPADAWPAGRTPLPDSPVPDPSGLDPVDLDPVAATTAAPDPADPMPADPMPADPMPASPMPADPIATPTTSERSDDSGDRWVVEVVGSDPLPARSQVLVLRRRRPAHRLTCRVGRETSAWAYEAVRVTVLP